MGKMVNYEGFRVPFIHSVSVFSAVIVTCPQEI